MGLFILWKTSEICNLLLIRLYSLGWSILHDKELKSNLRKSQKLSSFFFFFFLSGFSSQALTIHRTAREGREPSFIPQYHFHPLTSTETFICNFACEMTITYFWSQRLCLPDCYTVRFTTLWNYHLSDWLMMQCLFVYLMNWYWVLVTAIWHWKSVDLNSHRLSPLYYKWTD